MSADSGTPNTTLGSLFLAKVSKEFMAKDIERLEREAAQLRSELKECREHLHDYGLANFVGQVEDEKKQLRAENEELRRLIERGRDSTATELGLSAQLETMRDGAAKLMADNEALAGALRDLLTEVESLDDYSLTRDTETYKAQACWDYANEQAYKALAAHAAKGEK